MQTFREMKALVRLPWNSWDAALEPQRCNGGNNRSFRRSGLKPP